MPSRLFGGGEPPRSEQAIEIPEQERTIAVAERSGKQSEVRTPAEKASAIVIEAEKAAARNRAEATRVIATGSSEIIALDLSQARLASLQQAPEVAVKPLEEIGEVSIIDLGGLDGGAAGEGGGTIAGGPLEGSSASSSATGPAPPSSTSGSRKPGLMATIPTRRWSTAPRAPPANLHRSRPHDRMGSVEAIPSVRIRGAEASRLSLRSGAQ